MSKLLTASELAERLRVKTHTVYRWAAEGVIPHVWLQKELRFDPDQVESWIRQNTVARAVDG